MNAGTNTEVAFKRRITPCATSNRHKSDRTATDNLGGGDNPDGDDHGNGDGPEDDLPEEPDDNPPDDNPPDDDNPDDPDNDVQNNLADAITALARNVRHQGDGSRSKVQELVICMLAHIWLSSMICDICTTFEHNGHHIRMCCEPLGVYAMAFRSFPTSYDPYRHFMMFLCYF